MNYQKKYLDRAYAAGNMRNNQTSHWNPFDKLKSALKGPTDERPRYNDKPAYVGTAPVKIKEHIPSPDFAPSDTQQLTDKDKK